MKKRQVCKETHAESWTLSKMRREINAWRDYISHEIYVSKELDVEFNHPNIHLMSHWVKLIHRDGVLQPNSDESHEQAHKMNLKDGWKASNHNVNSLPQEITIQRRILCFETRELNLQALTQHRENSTAPAKSSLLVLIWLPPQSSQLYPKH